ncbi:MAG: hypothetical protein HC831_26205 [Chloroflexia bacterium]|nr:hypothetical protein [Chloroflexia bacterium]
MKSITTILFSVMICIIFSSCANEDSIGKVPSGWQYGKAVDQFGDEKNLKGRY